VPVVTHLPIEILDYLGTHAPPRDSSYGISQRELANALGYHPCSMSRPLAELVETGHLERRRAYARGGQRKQLAYWLTEQGRQHLQRQNRAVPLLSGAIPAPPNPFVGRREELATIRRLSEGLASVVFVDGPPGMGKTALVTRYLRSAKGGRAVFWFTVRESSSPRDFALALAHVLAPLGAPQLAYYSQAPHPPVGREVASLAIRALGDRPLLGVIDDVQFATSDLRRFLDEFVPALSRERPGASQHVLIVTGQKIPAFQWPDVATQRVTVGGLDRAAAHELTDRRGGLADKFERVYQSTFGSPLLLLLAVTTPDVEASSATLPAVVVGRLRPDEVRAILPIALAHEPLPPSWVMDYGGISVEQLNSLIRSGLLQRGPSGRVEMLQVVREALLNRVDPSAERSAHRGLSVFYSRSRRADALRERFLHLVAAEEWKPALQLLSHQQKTLLSLGYSDHLRHSLRRLAMGLPPGIGRVRVYRAEAAILHLHSQHAEAVLSLRQAITEAGGDPRLTAECLLEMVEPQIRMRQIDEASQTLERVRNSPQLTGRLRPLFLLDESRVLEARGSIVQARDTCLTAFQLARRYRQSDVALQSIPTWTRLAIIRGEQEVALRTVDEMLPEARRSGRMDIVFNMLLTQARAHAELGRRDLAEAAMLEIKAESEALGYLGHLAYALSGLSAMMAEAGRWAEALNYARQASSLAERLGQETVLAHTLAVMCWAEHRQGRLEDARAHGERSLSILASLPPTDTSVLAHVYLTEVYLDLRDLEKARREYAEALDLARSLGADWLRAEIEKEFRGKLDPT
jgi:tetratricopeptide (TPR) repeat protein/DNA-binding MarR family transcriptional regulator